MSAPLRRYAAMSDEVEHIDSELSESLVQIRSDIEVCVRECVCVWRCACSHKHVHMHVCMYGWMDVRMHVPCKEHTADDIHIQALCRNNAWAQSRQVRLCTRKRRKLKK